MRFDIELFNTSLINKQAVNEVMKCNELTTSYGLTLTNTQALELVDTRIKALNANGRIEFGGGVIDKIIKEFYDSPYISMHNYERTLHELIEMFYLYKNETLDLISDDNLIRYMKNAFDGICQGSLDLLSGRELYNLAYNLRYGQSNNSSDESDFEDEGDENEEY